MQSGVVQDTEVAEAVGGYVTYRLGRGGRGLLPEAVALVWDYSCNTGFFKSDERCRKLRVLTTYAAAPRKVDVRLFELGSERVQQLREGRIGDRSLYLSTNKHLQYLIKHRYNVF